MRDRHVSVCDSVFWIGVRAGSESFASNILRPPACGGNEHRMATAGENSSDRSRRHRRDTAHGKQLRGHARPDRERTAHLPSRLRSLLWILSSLPIMAERGQYIADESEVWSELYARLPTLRPAAAPIAAATA